MKARTWSGVAVGSGRVDADVGSGFLEDCILRLFGDVIWLTKIRVRW